MVPLSRSCSKCLFELVVLSTSKLSHIKRLISTFFKNLLKSFKGESGIRLPTNPVPIFL